MIGAIRGTVLPHRLVDVTTIMDVTANIFMLLHFVNFRFILGLTSPIGGEHRDAPVHTGGVPRGLRQLLRRGTKTSHRDLLEKDNLLTVVLALKSRQM